MFGVIICVFKETVTVKFWFLWYEQKYRETTGLLQGKQFNKDKSPLYNREVVSSH